MGKHGKHRPLVSHARRAPWQLLRGVGLWLLLALTPLAAQAQGGSHCRLALVLALDVSASVDSREYQLQRDGLARALLLPQIRQALLNGNGAVALSAYEWSGRYQQKVILPWLMIRTPEDILRASSRLSEARRSHSGFPTATGYALGFGAGLLRDAPACDRQVLDLSGDGINNEGFGPELAYRNFPFAGVVVNGLAILGPDEGVYDFYQQHVIRGPGAFLEVANGFEDFAHAMGLKLFREINDLQMGQAETPPECCG
ncbi:DUF1194 domain-containing protein [Pseudooceanicola sp. HF7]|uniref:DUF1194 domain-containing protein n=1 Tax=Pseudooceanicola sp. HF7 TaxID=2721560 RepID=UPI0020CA49A6|nr:DUF1194 domain-containing protein [Pseudooceanicola sp. HF7]